MSTPACRWRTSRKSWPIASKLVQSLVDVPLSIDSSIVAALEAGLSVYQGKPLLNSVTGEEERLEAVLPLVKKYGCAVVAISNDESGISEDPDVRFEVARKIVHRAADYGIPKEDIVVDPLVMPIGAINQAGRQVFYILNRLRDELGVNSTCGASNIGFGLPNRPGLNAAFLEHGGLFGHDLGDYESLAFPRGRCRDGGRCDERQRSRLPALAEEVPRSRRRGREPARPGRAPPPPCLKARRTPG